MTNKVDWSQAPEWATHAITTCENWIKNPEMVGRIIFGIKKGGRLHTTEYCDGGCSSVYIVSDDGWEVLQTRPVGVGSLSDEDSASLINHPSTQTLNWQDRINYNPKNENVLIYNGERHVIGVPYCTDDGQPVVLIDIKTFKGSKGFIVDYIGGKEGEVVKEIFPYTSPEITKVKTAGEILREVMNRHLHCSSDDNITQNEAYEALAKELGIQDER